MTTRHWLEVATYLFAFAGTGAIIFSQGHTTVWTASMLGFLVGFGLARLDGAKP